MTKKLLVWTLGACLRNDRLKSQFPFWKAGSMILADEEAI